jgi:hypothetical protein
MNFCGYTDPGKLRAGVLISHVGTVQFLGPPGYKRGWREFVLQRNFHRYVAMLEVHFCAFADDFARSPSKASRRGLDLRLEWTDR